uniref:Multidrug and toxin extrusion protein n=1 Tax=Gasterosteus aculeatus aculeatus TaxID=481459 RepID=A0AAQ4R428_GASAC
MEGSSDRFFCCKWLRHKVPLAHREELYHILRMTGPLLLSRILNYLLPFVVTMFCGRLGNEVMAGYGLASATINVTTAATGYGLALACDTLVSQTFGGKNLLRVGVILQRGIIILLLFCLPCWGLLLNAQAILLCLGQNPEVARYSRKHVPMPLLTLLVLIITWCLCTQGIILPQMYSAAVANIANVVTNCIFLYWLDLGVGGSAAANTLSQIYICTFLFSYIWWKKLHVKTWGGWSAESLQEWGSYMKLAFPSTLMKCFEWWVYELGGFFAGMLSEDELAAQHAVIMVAFITYMFPLGIQAAACARVGNALGAGDTGRAILTCKMSFALAGIIAVIEGLLLGSTKSVIGFIFTPDEKITGLVSYLMNAYCFLQFFDAFMCVCSGIFLGTGKQKIPAVGNFIGFYCIGLPLSVTLTFVTKLRILGFWLGLLVGLILLCSFYITIISRLNWEEITQEVCSAGRQHLDFQELFVSCKHLRSSTLSVLIHLLNWNLYFLNCCQCHDGDSDTQCDQVVRLKGGHLSTGQLILRRGLTAFAAVGLLAVGAAVHFLVPRQQTNFTLDWNNTTHTHQILSTAQVPN